ncbi:hypothetical protein AB1K54_01865 [Microbacterium sp. BWT-B31]|uniref:hypothetical protein n=1 Tax=Microbacterium sp. BWT-B31 TaxID=3232072 RepID=UPI003527FEB8
MTAISDIPAAGSISAAADQLLPPFVDLIAEVDAIIADWNALSAVYSAPEAEHVYTAWTPLDTFVEGLHSVADSARGALDTYATSLTGLHTRRATLVRRLADLEAMDHADPLYDSERADLNADVRVFRTDAEAADEDCAAALRALTTQIGSLQLAFPQTLGGPFTDLTLGIGGGALGAWGGAAAGAAIGSVVPGVGTVIGGVVGGIIGGVLGGWGSSEAADAIVDEVEE